MKALLSCMLLLWSLAASDKEVDLGPFGFEQARIHVGDDPEFADISFDDGQWGIEYWQNVEERGVWWLRGRLTLPEPYLANSIPVGLYLIGSASAEAWWDGRFIGRNGRVATSAREEVPGAVNAVIAVPPDALTPGEHLIAIRFSSHHAGSGIATPIDGLFLAPYGSPLRWTQARYRPALVMGGALGLAAAFLAVLWTRERERRIPWLLLACVAALVQLAFEVSRAYFAYPYSWHEERLAGIAICTGLGGLGIAGYLLQRFALPGARWWLLAIGTGAAALLLSGWPIGFITWLIILLWLVAALIVCALALRDGHRTAWAALAALGLLLVAMIADPDGFTDRTYFLGFVVLVLLFFADTVATHARIRRERDAARLRMARLELELLKRHLRPHFLMNTLTALSEWVETEPETGAAMIDALAREFRLLDATAERPLVSLEQELELCRAHLRVMSFRQGREYHLDVVGETDLQVPPAVLHTLVENALTHGDYARKKVRFRLQAERQGDQARLTFRCPQGESPITAGPEGTGLGYIRARLREAFGERADLESGPVDGGWQTRIRLPLVSNGAMEPSGSVTPYHHGFAE